VCILFRYLFTWELINDFLALFLNSSVNYSSFWNFILDRYKRRGLVQTPNLIKMLGVRKAFQDSSVSYMILQEINYKSISCVCGGENGILMDGTRVSMKSLASRLDQAWRVPPASGGARPLVEREKLVFIAGCDKATRELLIRFVLRRNRFDVKQKKLITNSSAGLLLHEYTQLVNCLPTNECKRAQLLSFLLADAESVGAGEKKRYCAKVSFTKLLAALVSDYPIQSILPFTIVPSLKELLKSSSSVLSQNISLQKDFRLTVPLIYDFLVLLGKVTDEEFIRKAKALLCEMCEMSVAAFGVGDSRDPNHELKYSAIYPEDLDYFTTGHFYPHLPVLRYVPTYLKDRNSKSASACNKFVRSAGNATAGLFLAFCIEHGKYIGFHAMVS